MHRSFFNIELIALTRAEWVGVGGEKGTEEAVEMRHKCFES